MYCILHVRVAKHDLVLVYVYSSITLSVVSKIDIVKKMY